MREKKSGRILLIRSGSRHIQRIRHPWHCTPAYTLKYAEVLLKQTGKYQVKLIDCLSVFMTREALVAEALTWSPDLVVISTNTITLKEAFEFASLLKKRKDIFIIAAGHCLNSDLEKIYPGQCPFDVVFSGEAEREIFFLAEKLYGKNDWGRNSRETNDFNLKKNKEEVLVEDLDSLPLPVYTPQELEQYNFIYPLRINKRVVWGHILSSRGCPYSCIFCSPVTRTSYGKTLRLRSAENITQELFYLKSLGANVIAFDDDNFTFSAEHVESVCRQIIKSNLDIKWIAHARVDNINPGLLRIMKDAGCVLLRFGIESGSRRIINVLKKDGSGKDWIERCKIVFKESRKIGVSTAALFIVGSPTESKTDVAESIDLAKELNPDLVQVHFFTPYPGSAVYESFKSQIENNNLVSDMHHYIAPTLNLSNLDLDLLRKSQIGFYKKFFFRPKFIFCHLIKYTFFYLHNMKILFRLIRSLCSL